MRCAEPPLMGDKLQTGFEQGTKCSSAGCAFLSSSECLASPVGLYMVALAFTSMKVSGYLFFEATPVPLLLAGGCVFLGLWPRKGCGCFLSQDFAQISMPLPLSPLCLPSTSQVCSALFSSLSLSPKPSISRYPKSPYLGTELLCDFIWCFMSLSLWKEAQFSGFRVQERSFKDSIPLFFCFLLPPVILCLPSLNSPGLSPWAQGTQGSCPDDGEPETQTHHGVIYALLRPPTGVWGTLQGPMWKEWGTLQGSHVKSGVQAPAVTTEPGLANLPILAHLIAPLGTAF